MHLEFMVIMMMILMVMMMGDHRGNGHQEGQERNHQNGQTNITQHILFPQEKSLSYPLFGK